MNHLKGETSPYLLQHVNNPVDWYPYTKEALDKARTENKLIFLSIGYSACHWCHVMAHESFENVQIAELLNKHYVSIKVDREERPDLDQIYQIMGQLLGKQGGWPLSVFLTPNGNPLFIGTYFPASARFGITSFPELITTLASRYQENAEKFEATGQSILEATQKALSGQFDTKAHQNPIFRLENDEKSPEFMENILLDLATNFDTTHGGFGNAPKFPNFSILVFILRQLAEFHPELSPSMQDLAEKVKLTLDRMANGGIYDQIGGGFHRYTVDAQWLTPHFEKMLYDNAMALLAYTEGYLYFGNPLYKEKVAEILQWAIREMYLPEKGFYSSLDADSEGREGQYYVWTQDEIEQLVPVDDWALVMQAFGVTKKGNFEKKGNILQRVQSNEELAATFSLDISVISQKMHAATEILLKARESRTPPHRDEKILLS
ncbi:MAG: thioredoxin domain-containing protein, partial [Promethearchaeota archaeon]